MRIYDYEAAFGAGDKTTKAMKEAIAEWFRLYYGDRAGEDSDPSQRIAYTVVNKIVKAMFGEYQATASDPAQQALVDRLDAVRKQAVQLALVGGECYLKPCPEGNRFQFTLIPRDQVLVFGRDPDGCPNDMGMLERSVYGNAYYTLLERRWLDADGCLCMGNKLYRSGDGSALGSQVSLGEHPAYAHLPERYRYPQPLGGLGLVRMKTPMLNCVDGSADGVAVFAPVAELIRNIDRNEAQLSGEFSRGESRLVVSRDLLSDNQLRDNLFVALDEDPEQVGMTVFSPQLRYEAYLARKQEYLRNVESVVGLRRGMLTDVNMDERTATEITSSAGDFNLTVIEFQKMWQTAHKEALQLCCQLAQMYAMAYPKAVEVSIDWGNSTLYDEDKLWEQYRQMAEDGLIAPEVALGWRFGLPSATEEERKIIRSRYMAE